MSVTIREFWRSPFIAPRIALVFAGVAGALNLGSYAGLGMNLTRASAHNEDR